ncbi:carbohydrate ABC transporter permease [Brachybacterium sp. EE-P12]|uniref:carbohydrate ABC transporter permease n=1 Tax=Brachybacterium sp. EE-P12 TaxID=2306299 RepID=UPI000F098050|nr:carbohydrate ABC transporter permease [Brachybacterium sp. EE-P12]
MKPVMGRRSRVLTYAVLVALALMTAFPVLYALSVSLMSQADFNAGAFLPSRPEPANYARAMESFPLLKYLANSVIMSLLVTVALLVTSSTAAFAFTFVAFRGRGIFFGLIIATMMIPWEATIIVNFQTVRDLDWLNTFAGLSVPSFATAFGIFLLRQSFLTLPQDLYDAARIDGCPRRRFFVTMVIPLSRPMLATLAVYGFLTTWNKYLWPLLVTSDDRVRTVQIGLKMMQGEEMTAWPVVMAAVVMAIVPTLVVLLFGVRSLQRGLMSGALKG